MIIINPEIDRVKRRLSAQLSLLREFKKGWIAEFPDFDPADYAREADAKKYLLEIKELRAKLRELQIEAGRFDREYAAMNLRPSADDVWKPIPIEGLGKYEASAGGFIRSRVTGNLYARRAAGKRLWVSLIKDNGTPVRLRVDKLVATTWLPESPSNHLAAINGDGFDCRKENLRWMS